MGRPPGRGYRTGWDRWGFRETGDFSSVSEALAESFAGRGVIALFPDGANVGKWGVVPLAAQTPGCAGMRFVRVGEGGGTGGAPSLIVRAGQRAVPVFETADAVMGSGFMRTAAKFDAAVIHSVWDVGSDEGDDG